MIKNSCMVLAVAFLLILPAAADTFDWSYSGPGVSASGTFTTDPLSGGTYQITNITGERNGATITALSDFALANNLLYPAFPYVDLFGFSYVAGGVDYNLYWPDWQPIPSGTQLWDEVWLDANSNVNDTYVDFSYAPVPEPASLVLLGGGLVGLAGRLRRRLSS